MTHSISASGREISGTEPVDIFTKVKVLAVIGTVAGAILLGLGIQFANPPMIIIGATIIGSSWILTGFSMLFKLALGAGLKMYN